jgi:DNA-directed RNA polymerase specialized sigma24 family protein
MPGLDTVWVGWQDVARRALRASARWARHESQDDVVQEVALAMLRRHAAGAVDEWSPGLVATITRRIAGKHWRKQQRLPVSIDGDHVAPTDAGFPELELRDLLVRLPAALRRVAERKLLEGHTLRDIAKADRVPPARIQRLWEKAQMLLATALGVGKSGSREVGESGSREARRGPRFSRNLIQSGGSRAHRRWTRGNFALAA